MVFENHTPFPAMGWSSWDKQGIDHASVVVRIKYLFDEMDAEGLWSLRLDPDQGELFGEEYFYDDDLEASLRFESDFVPFKPAGDLILNAYSYSATPRESWVCGVKAIRHPKGYTNPPQTLVEQQLRVYGERYWQDNVRGWGVGSIVPTTKVALRYEYAFGGFVLDPYAGKASEEGAEYLHYDEQNPVGRGWLHKKMDRSQPIPMPQIEAIDNPVTKAYTSYAPVGLGAIHRSWLPRRNFAGTFDEAWLEKKHPVMPDDFDEWFNQAAHPALQLTRGEYFHGGDTIVLHRLLPGKEAQAFRLPDFHMIAKQHIAQEQLSFALEIDTIVVDILSEDMSENAIYVSYRARVPYLQSVEKISLSMVVPETFIEEKQHG
jgi:hypothetical protein